MRADLGAAACAVQRQEVLDAVDTLHPAIEIPDSRFADFATPARRDHRRHACAHLFVLGAPASADWRALDLVEERPIIALRGKQYVGHGRNVLAIPASRWPGLPMNCAS